MALGPTEVWRQGFVVDTTTGARVFTTDSAQARWSQGFFRDPDGRLVEVSR